MDTAFVKGGIHASYKLTRVEIIHQNYQKKNLYTCQSVIDRKVGAPTSKIGGNYFPLFIEHPIMKLMKFRENLDN